MKKILTILSFWKWNLTSRILNKILYSVLDIIKYVFINKHKKIDYSQQRWDRHYLKMANFVASKSKDNSTQVGCVIVGPSHEVRSTGYNGMPRGVEDSISKVPKRFERPEKYKWFEHAERNAVYNAARCGTPLEGCIAYIEYFPCTDCARSLIQSGIIRIVVTHHPDFEERYAEEMKTSKVMLYEAGVIIDVY